MFFLSPYGYMFTLAPNTQEVKARLAQKFISIALIKRLC